MSVDKAQLCSGSPALERVCWPKCLHAVRADQAAGWRAMGFDELVLTADIELIRSAFETLVAKVRHDVPR